MALKMPSLDDGKTSSWCRSATVHDATKNEGSPGRANDCDENPVCSLYVHTQVPVISHRNRFNYYYRVGYFGLFCTIRIHHS
jgi:hypothetical protein